MGRDKILLLDNGKKNANIFFQYIKEQIQREFGNFEIVYEQKPSFNKPIAPSRFENNNICSVLTGPAEWPACASWSIHDLATLKQLGVDNLNLICTAGFEVYLKALAKSRGLEGLNLIIIEKALADSDQPVLFELSQKIFPYIKLAE